jgi:two-component system response regulator AtoC
MLAQTGLTETGSGAAGTATRVRDFSDSLQKSPSLRILVVDDEPLIRWSVAETLMDRGYDVLEAGSGAGALHALAEPRHRVDVVLLDYRLPDSLDLRLLATIRRIAPQTKVILVTAYGTPELATGALELGAYRVVNKPIEMSDLAALVQQAHASKP